MADIYKGILDAKGVPIRLVELAAMYRSLPRSSMEHVADVLTKMGYHSKNGGPVNRHQVFRAIMRTSDGQKLIHSTRRRLGKWI